MSGVRCQVSFAIFFFSFFQKKWWIKSVYFLEYYFFLPTLRHCLNWNVVTNTMLIELPCWQGKKFPAALHTSCQTSICPCKACQFKAELFILISTLKFTACQKYRDKTTVAKRFCYIVSFGCKDCPFRNDCEKTVYRGQRTEDRGQRTGDLKLI